MKKLLPFLLLTCLRGNAQLFRRLFKPTTQTTQSVQPVETIQPSESVSVTSFGAKCDGVTDDILAWEAARDYVLVHPMTLTMPVGNSYISRPLLLQRVVNGQNVFFTIHIKGALPNKSSSNEYLSRITCGFKAGYGIGIELGRSIVIENLTIMGQYGFPYTVDNKRIGTLKFSDWVDPTITDSRYAPYAGISIDPNPLLQGGQGGTSDVTITNCSIVKWMVGVMLTANGTTANDEMINILEDEIDACRVSIAIGQDQAKTVNIKGLKVWASVHTVLDGLHYGARTGGGSVFCENWNIAGNVNELFNLNTDRFPLSCKDIYSESLFRIGYVGFGTGANFINTQIDFLNYAGLPAADYLIGGQANFYGGMLRYYDGQPSHRMNLVGCPGWYRDMTMNQQPFVQSMSAYGYNIYPVPTFENVNNYYRGGPVYNGGETITRLDGVKSIVIDQTSWTGTVVGNNLGSQVAIGDYILGSPDSQNRKFYDAELNPMSCNTIQIGRVTAINGDVVSVDDVGINCPQTVGYDGVFVSKLK